MKTKPKLSFWQIWNMSFGFLGIQFGFALQNANVSRIFETLGAKIDDIPILWIAAPVTGLIIQPIIGHASDKTWCRLGRRRPYFLAGALLASIALFIMPNSPALWIAAGMLWMMDASINVSMEPFRAFVGDMLPSDQRTTGFAMQSFFIGTGAVIASLLPYMMANWFGISNTAPEGIIPPSVKFSFYIGGAVFISAVAWTVFSSKEYSPEELKEFDDHKEDVCETDEDTNNKEQIKKSVKLGLIFTILGILLSIAFYFTEVEKEVYILSFGLFIFGILELLSGSLQKSNKKGGFVSVFNDLNSMPKTMGQLAIVQFFSWFALFAMWIYTTAGVTAHVYGTTDTTSELYNEGANWVGVCFGVYNGFAALFAFLLIWMAKITSRKITHSISLLVGGLSFISIFFIKDSNMLLIPFAGIGLTWASILAMPYAMLTGALPSNKMGVYMGIFNFFIVIPQILAASILGFLVKSIFKEEAIYALILGGISLIIAAFLVIFVKDDN
ncbi:MAG: MFS transporter [Bacteroidetes bacterium]|nr:MAG: MFS transporter [Bacteroidota bacterium]